MRGVLLRVPPIPDKAIAQDSTLCTLNIRYKNPGESDSKLLTKPVSGARVLAQNSKDFNFANAVAMFGAKLRNPASGVKTQKIMDVARENMGSDKEGYRLGFLNMIQNFMKINTD